MKVVFNLKAVILSTFLSLTLLFFLGTFSNSYSSGDFSYLEDSWHYINRGFPKAWAGVALADSQVSFPHVVLPFLNQDDGRGTKLVKIIDVRLFLVFFIPAFIAWYIPSFILAKATEENSHLTPFFILLSALTTLALLFIYFSLFLRI